MKKFAIIGAAGYVAPRHMEAIKNTGNILVTAYDKADSVGIIDRYFPAAAFFVEFERFDRYLEKLKMEGQGIDYLTVCSPNYLHDSHIRFGLKIGAHVICEKPLVLNPWNLNPLRQIQTTTGKKIYNLLQLREHPQIQDLKKEVEQNPEKSYNVILTYIVSRGNWYYTSWKGDESKSGGIATNIGIHLFDMLIWIFGEVKKNIVNLHTHDRATGILKFENAIVKWFLSINNKTIPIKLQEIGVKTLRVLQMENREINFSDGFEELHTESYKQILQGQGCSVDEAEKSIELVYNIRTSDLEPISMQSHPLANLPLVMHPFDRN